MSARPRSDVTAGADASAKIIAMWNEAGTGFFTVVFSQNICLKLAAIHCAKDRHVKDRGELAFFTLRLSNQTIGLIESRYLYRRRLECSAARTLSFILSSDA